MDNNTSNPVPQNTPQATPSAPMQNQENKSSIGSILGTIIIIAIIILGALYFWGKRLEESRAAATLNNTNNQANVVETLPPIEIHVTATSTSNK